MPGEERMSDTGVASVPGRLMGIHEDIGREGDSADAYKRLVIHLEDEIFKLTVLAAVMKDKVTEQDKRRIRDLKRRFKSRARLPKDIPVVVKGPLRGGRGPRTYELRIGNRSFVATKADMRAAASIMPQTCRIEEAMLFLSEIHIDAHVLMGRYVPAPKRKARPRRGRGGRGK